MWADDPTVTLTPTADTYLDWANTTTSYGDATTLKTGTWGEYWTNATPGIKTNGTSNIAIIKFTLNESQRGKVTAATLTVVGHGNTVKNSSINLGYCTLKSNGNVDWSNSNWEETTTNASNAGINIRDKSNLNIQPLNLSQSINQNATAKLTFTSSDLVNVLNSQADVNGNVTLILYTNGTRECTVSSKEDTDNAPQLTITYTTAATTTYTINYTFDGATVKSETKTGVVGQNAETLDVFTEAGQKYFAATQGTTYTIAADGTISVPVRKAYTATATLTTKLDGIQINQKNFSYTEADDRTTTYKLPWTKYILNASTYGELTNEENLTQNGTFTDGQTITKEVNYTSSKDLVYYKEAEACSNHAYAADGDYSGGQQAMIQAGKAHSCGTLQPGNYTFEIYVINDGKRDIKLTAGTADLVTYASTETTGLKTFDFTLTEATEMKVQGSGASCPFDYIAFRRPTVAVSITAAGLATYCPSVGLDFTGNTAVAAYKAQAGETTVNLTRVYKVKAGEGVLLRSLAGGAVESTNVNVDMTAEELTDNQFVGVQEDIAALASQTDGKKNYILNNVGGTIGFYPANGQSVAAGRAYLRLDAATAAKGFALNWDDNETNGIAEIATQTKSDDAAVYNLRGQRIAKPAHGLYIRGGKKVIIK